MKIYTSYFANLKNLEKEDIFPIGICCYLPKWLEEQAGIEVKEFEKNRRNENGTFILTMNKFKQIRMSRLNDNIEVLNILVDYLKQNPDIRFFQALYNVGIMDSKNVDRFYEEPSETLSRMKKTEFVKNHEKMINK